MQHCYLKKEIKFETVIHTMRLLGGVITHMVGISSIYHILDSAISQTCTNL